MTEQPKSYKVLILGDCSVGKTSLLIRYIDGKYNDSELLSSVGMDLKIKFLKYQDRDIQLELWDTAGQERFHSITNNFLKHSDGVVILYDITNKETFVNIKYWVKSINESLNIKDIEVVLVGNKCDCDDFDRDVTYEEGKEVADKYGVDFFETSCKEDINVNQTFITLIEGMMKVEERKKEIASTRERSSSKLEKRSTNEKEDKNERKEKQKKECGC